MKVAKLHLYNIHLKKRVEKTTVLINISNGVIQKHPHQRLCAWNQLMFNLFMPDSFSINIALKSSNTYKSDWSKGLNSIIYFRQQYMLEEYHFLYLLVIRIVKHRAKKLQHFFAEIGLKCSSTPISITQTNYTTTNL